MRRNPITLVFRSPSDAVKFLETLEATIGSEIAGELKMNKVKIYVYARGERYKEIVRRIQALYSTVRGTYTPGLRRYEFSALLSISESKTPVSPQVVVELLKLRGFEARLLKGGYIETNADTDTLREIIGELSRAYARLVRLPATTPAKRLVALLSVYWGISVEETVERLVEKGLLRNENRLEPTHNFSRALELAISGG